MANTPETVRRVGLAALVSIGGYFAVKPTVEAWLSPVPVASGQDNPSRTDVAGNGVANVTEAVATATPVSGAGAERRASSNSFSFPVPKDFRPEVPGGMQNVLLEKAGQGVWFHPMTTVRFLGNQEHVWSYQYYFGWRSTGQDNLTLVQHAGEEGRLVFRQEKGPSTLVLGVGMLDRFTDNSGATKDLRGDIRTGFKADVVPSVWIRTHPAVTVRVFDADTGLPVMKDGEPVKGTTSESGDIGFGLSEKGRWVLVMDIPYDPKLETFVWKGPHDRVQEDVNWIDLRELEANSGQK